MFQSLVGVLPETISGASARYALAMCAGLSTGIIVRLAALAARHRSEQRATPEPGQQTAPFVGLSRLVDGTTAALLASCSTVDDPERGRLTGWAHFLEEGEAGEPPTAIGTAYGLHTVLTLGAADGRLAPSELVETLWRLRLPDGGWAARTGAGVGRPEVTALVVGVLSRAGADRGQLEEAVASLERMLQSGEDTEGLARTYVVTTALRGLIRAAPHSPLIPSLRAELLAGTLRDTQHGGLLCWGAWLGAPTGLWSAPSPSTVHTAQAVLALSRAAQVLEEDNQCRQSREQGVRWLLTAGNLDNRVEHVGRSLAPPQQGHDHAVVRHFTAAWVARALLSTPAGHLTGDAESEQRRVDRLEASLAAVWRSQRDGVWGWEDDRYLRPIWMTYQGLSVLRSPELCGWTPPHD